MFKKNGKEINIKEAETIIGPSIKVKGNFHGDGNIIVEGTLEGAVQTSKDLYVGNNAKILANVSAKNAHIGGEVRGDVKIDGYLEVSASAKIIGDVETKTISIEKGGLINGKLTMMQAATNDKKS